MANLFNVLDHEVSDDVIGKIGTYLNEPPARTKDGLAKAIPAILCTLHQKTATTAGQNEVFGMLQRGGFDARPRESLATIASSPGGLADLAKVGGPLVAALFGARQSPLIDWLASAAGLSKSAATSLLALAAPMVLSVTGRLSASTGTFDVASVTRLIKDQGVALASASPAGLAQALGVNQCGEAAVGVPPAAASGGLWWWLLPLLLLALLFFAWRSCQREPVREAVAPPAPRPAATTVSVPAPAPKAIVFSDAALFEFDKSELKPEGKAKISEYRELAKEELSRANKVVITGYTDNVGAPDYNATLSLKRAEAVRDYLISLGADPTKFEVSGAGEAKPIADNSTDEGRAKNRRVEVLVFGVGK